MFNAQMIACNMHLRKSNHTRKNRLEVHPRIPQRKPQDMQAVQGSRLSAGLQFNDQKTTEKEKSRKSRKNHGIYDSKGGIPGEQRKDSRKMIASLSERPLLDDWLEKKWSHKTT